MLHSFVSVSLVGHSLTRKVNSSMQNPQKPLLATRTPQ